MKKTSLFILHVYHHTVTVQRSLVCGMKITSNSNVVPHVAFSRKTYKLHVLGEQGNRQKTCFD